MTETVSRNNVNNIVFGLAIALLVLLVFGMACLISKFISVMQNERASVFGMSIMYVADSSNAEIYSSGSSVIIHNTAYENLKLGDFVVFGNANNGNLYYTNFGEVTLLTDNAFVVHPINTNLYVTVHKSNYIAKSGSASFLLCGLVAFLLSDWLLWLFIIIPAVTLIGILLLLLKLHLSNGKAKYQQLLLPEPKQLLLTEKSVVFNDTQIIKKKRSKNNTIKKKSIVEEIDGSRQMFIDFSSLQDASSKPKVSKEKNKTKKKLPSKISGDNLLPNIAKIDQKQEVAKPKVVISKPKAKRQGDDYIYKKLPTMDTNTPLKILLGKFTKEKEQNAKSELLEKMRKQ